MAKKVKEVNQEETVEESKVSSQMKAILDSIEKRFGKEAISGTALEVEFLKTGSIGLDNVLGGGWAKGRIVELIGWESSGKSTIALHAAAECQKQGKAVVYVDMEHALDPFYAQALGVNVDIKSGLWYMSQPDNGETALEIVREFAKSDEVGLIVVDSVTALIPKAVIAGEAGDSKMGLLARLMSSMLPTLIAPAKKSGVVILFIGQLREKIGIFFGNNETTTGGHALKFYASQRVNISRSGQTKDGEEVTANGCKCKIVKNKVSPPFKVCKFDICFGKGIDKVTEVIDFAVEMDIVTKKGAGWYSYGETKLGQGMDSVKNLMEDNIELFKEIENKVKDNLKAVK